MLLLIHSLKQYDMTIYLTEIIASIPEQQQQKVSLKACTFYFR